MAWPGAAHSLVLPDTSKREGKSPGSALPATEFRAMTSDLETQRAHMQSDATAAAEKVLSHDAQYARVEAETRRNRPATDTAGRAFRVWLRAPSVLGALFFALVSALWRILTPGSSPWEWVAVAGVLVGWPLLEWSAHRWILHLRPRRIFGVLIDPYFAQRHRTHHQNPSYFPDVFLPFGVVVGAWFVFSGALWLLKAPGFLIATFMLSMSIAACVYEWMHFMAHADFVPPGNWLKRVAERHRQHHYRNEQAWFAFSVPAVDDVFGTGGHVRSVPRSSTTRTIGIPAQD